MTESETTPADPESTPEEDGGIPANPGEDPSRAPVDTETGPTVGRSDQVDAVQDGAPATGPEAPTPPTA
jgi:hypothetical protein